MRRIAITLSSLLLVLAFVADPAAQSTGVKPTLKPADYDQFESVAPAAARGGLSPDGKWFAYSVTKVGGDSELRVTQLGGTVTKSVQFGSGATFSPNSQWIAYSIGVSEAEQERLTAARQPVRRKVGILKLADQTETILDGIESFAFDRTSQSIAIKRSAPAPAAGAGPAAATPPPAPGGGRGGGAAAATAPAIGTTLLVRDLASGATMTFGNVTEYSWQPRDGARLLAMIISADGQAGNGIQVFDAGTSVLRPLESTATDYSALVWRDDSADLVALKAKNDDKRDGPTQLVLAWSGVGTSAEHLQTLDHIAGNMLPPTQRIVTFRRPSWLTGPSGSGPMLLLGVADWATKPTPPESGRGANAGRGAGAPSTNDKPDVDVWHWQDTRVNPVQKLQVAADKRRNLPAVWHVATNKLVVIGKSFDENVTPIRNTTQALVSEFTPYLMERSIGRGAADWFIADLTTGARVPLKANVSGNISLSTGGKYAIYAEDGQYLDDRSGNEGRHQRHEESEVDVC